MPPVPVPGCLSTRWDMAMLAIVALLVVHVVVHVEAGLHVGAGLLQWSSCTATLLPAL